MRGQPQLVVLSGENYFEDDLDFLLGTEIFIDEQPNYVQERIFEDISLMGYDSFEEAELYMGRGKFKKWLQERAKNIKKFAQKVGSGIKQHIKDKGEAEAQKEFQIIKMQQAHQKQMMQNNPINMITKNPIIPIALVAGIVLLMKKKG